MQQGQPEAAQQLPGVQRQSSQESASPARGTRSAKVTQRADRQSKERRDMAHILLGEPAPVTQDTFPIWERARRSAAAAQSTGIDVQTTGA